MNCKKTQDYLSPYLDQFLSQEKMRLVEKHLEKCAVCRQELEDLKETVHLIETLPECPLPIGFGKELHDKLVAVEEKGLKESGWPSGFRHLLSFRKQWVSLGMAAVLMIFAYAFLTPSLSGNTRQSDMDMLLNGVVQNEKKDDLSSNGNLETAENQLPDPGMDTQEKPSGNREEELSQKEQESSGHDGVTLSEKDIQNQEKVSSVVEDKNREAESNEQIRQGAGEAARSTNGEEEKKSTFRMTAIAPDHSIDPVEKKTILSDQDFQLLVKKDDYEEVFDRISGLRAERTDVLDVAYQSINGESEGFIISVAQGGIPKVWAEINAINSWISSVNREVYSSDAPHNQEEIISIKVVIKEKTN